MSGLFGALWPSAMQVDPTLAERMDRALAHRPAKRVYQAVFGPCLLGCRVAAEGAERARPFVGGGGCVCVLEGRLDRRAELQSALQLELAGVMSDEALVVLAYQRWGVRFAAHLAGDFAIALFDPHARRLLLVRDVMGARALYYALHRDGLLFASQAKPLLAAGVDATPSALRMAQYLARDFGDHEGTFFRVVKRVPPGCALVVERGTSTLHRYFELDARRALPARSSSEYAAQFRALFLDAVKQRATTSQKVGCMLSGGLDSSGVLGALRVLAPAREVPCFAARFPDFPAIDEGSWLSLCEARGGTTLHALRADRIGPLDDLSVLHDVCDEPFHAPNLFVYHRLSQLAAARGVHVLLDGLDGDTVVEHGFAYLHELLMRGRVRRLARELRALKRRLSSDYRSLIGSWLLAPETARAQALFARLGFTHAGYASQEFARYSGLRDYLMQAAQEALSAPSDYRTQHKAALSSPLLAFYLEVHDKVAASHGIDHRHPFFDRQLVEFCLALPGDQRLHDGWDRVVQRRAFVGLVADEIGARQSKSVWTDNFHIQLFTRHAALLRRLIESDRSPLRDVCDMQRLRRDWSELKRRPEPERVLDLWCAVTLGLWLEQAPPSSP